MIEDEREWRQYRRFYAALLVANGAGLVALAIAGGAGVCAVALGAGLALAGVAVWKSA